MAVNEKKMLLVSSDSTIFSFSDDLLFIQCCLVALTYPLLLNVAEIENHLHEFKWQGGEEIEGK